MEDQLIFEARQGNQGALARLLYDNYEMVFRYLIKFTLSRSLAEDIVQDTMVKAIEKFDKYDPAKSRFSSWLITIAQNTYLDRIRRNKSQQKYVEEGDVHEKLVEAVKPSDDSWGNVLDALAALGEEVRVPIVMKHYYGYSLEEIAKKMGIPLGTVKSRIHNGLNILRKELTLYE